MVGADGFVLAIPVATADAWPEPFALTARSSTKYSVPFSSGVVPSEDRVEMTTGLAVVPVSRVRQVAPASVEYSYRMIGEPPLSAGAVKAADSCASEPEIVSPMMVGAPGTVAGVAACGVDAAPGPTLFTARTLTS